MVIVVAFCVRGPGGRCVARASCLFEAIHLTSNQVVQLSFVQRAFVVTLLLTTSPVFPIRAQSFDVSQVGGPIAINALWRFHTGDNPQWASPTFDDSRWSLLRMDRSWSTQGYGGYTGYAWYRI